MFNVRTLTATVAASLCFVVAATAAPATTAPAAPDAAADAAPETTVTLKPGDPAPPLAVGEWVKGEPVKDFEEGKLYVVEFWATWCGPCKAAIPHLSELATENGDVAFIGVDIWEQDDSKVKPFVDTMGERMSYRVVMDDKSKDPTGAMATTWMDASGNHGIPTTFLVGRDKKIVWIGNSNDLADVLKKAKGDKFDATAEAKKNSRFAELEKQCQAAFMANDLDAYRKASKEVIALKPEMAMMLNALECHLLVKADRLDEARVLAKKVFEGSQTPDALNKVAWDMTLPASPKADDLTLARKASDKAMELDDGKDPDFLDTSARIYAAQGEWDKAIDEQGKAIAACSFESEYKENLVKTLEAYKKHTVPVIKD